jgi:hypothetical protein
MTEETIEKCNLIKITRNSIFIKESTWITDLFLILTFKRLFENPEFIAKVEWPSEYYNEFSLKLTPYQDKNRKIWYQSAQS